MPRMWFAQRLQTKSASLSRLRYWIASAGTSSVWDKVDSDAFGAAANRAAGVEFGIQARASGKDKGAKRRKAARSFHRVPARGARFRPR